MRDEPLEAKHWYTPMVAWFHGVMSEPRRYLSAGVHPAERIPLGTRIILGGYLLYRALKDSDLSVRAGSTAYTFVFAIVPLLTTSLAFFTAFAGDQSQKQLQAMLLNYLLPGAVVEVQEYIDQFTERAATAGTVSSLVFFVTILLLFQSLENTFNTIWRTERSRTWGERLQVLALIFIVGALAVATMVTLSRQTQLLADEMANFGLGGFLPALQKLGLHVAEMGTAWAVFILINKFLPRARVRWGPAAVGGIVAGTMWQLLKGGFTWYVQDVASYGHIYGAVGTVPVFFLWLYLSFLLLLLSAYAAFVTQNLRALVAWQINLDRGGDQPAFYAVAVTALLERAYQDRRGPLEMETLARRLGFDPFYIAQALKPMTRAGIVQIIPHGSDSPLYLLSVPGDALTVGEVVRLATGENLEVPETEAPSPLHTRIEQVFKDATSEEDNVLERVAIRALAEDIPGFKEAHGSD